MATLNDYRDQEGFTMPESNKQIRYCPYCICETTQTPFYVRDEDEDNDIETWLCSYCQSFN